MKRIIFLVDMNAFYIGCEMSRDHNLKGRPAAVAGDPKNRSGIILAPNYEARKFKVKTTMLVHEAKRLCPDLVLVPPDHGFYKQMSQAVMDILSKYTPVIQKNSIDEAWLDLTGCEQLFGKPGDIAKEIMQNINDKLDLWCSIGISENKFLSKMASEVKKPLGITKIWKKDIKEKIWPMPVGDMYGIGDKTEKKLNEIGLYTIGDIAVSGEKLMYDYFGKHGLELVRLANGIDDSAVVCNPRHDNKSISRSTTLSRDISSMDKAETILLGLSEKIGFEARKSNVRGKTVFIIIRYNDFETITRQKTISPTFLTRDIYNAGLRLLRDNWNSQKPVRLLGIGLSNIQNELFTQLSLFDIIKKRTERRKEEKLEYTVDFLRNKYGSDIIKRAKTVNGKKDGVDIS